MAERIGTVRINVGTDAVEHMRRLETYLIVSGIDTHEFWSALMERSADELSSVLKDRWIVDSDELAGIAEGHYSEGDFRFKVGKALLFSMRRSWELGEDYFGSRVGEAMAYRYDVRRVLPKMVGFVERQRAKWERRKKKGGRGK